MPEHYKVAVIGSGPGGLSAAGRAAEHELSHILLEATAKHSNTIQKYQKGKHVMAEPSFLPLRSPMSFEAGTREAILDSWEHSLNDLKVNIRYDAEVTALTGQKGDFTIQLKNGDTLTAEYIVMGIGMQGNPRRLGVDGEDARMVQYTLDDPDEYADETIVVVGAGDAAIENAVALAKRNRVIIVNRKDEFARAKEGNLNLITKSIESGLLECYYSSTVNRLEHYDDPEAATPGALILNTPTGEAEIKCHRIIARLGAIPPRKFVESCGIEFPSKDPNAIPALSATYESNVPGMYIVGALGGYPLIKQAMNQGYEVIEYILGNKINPADHPLLEERFKDLPYELDVDGILDLIKQRLPIFAEVNTLMLRELMLESTIWVSKPGDTIFEKNDYTNTFFTILDGNVVVEVSDTIRFPILQGQFFGEMSLLSGRRRSATIRAGEDCILIETPRRTMKKLISSDASVERVLDETFIIRALQSKFAPNAALNDLNDVAKQTNINQFKPGEVIFNEGDAGDSLHIVRTGSITVSKQIAGRDIVLSYVAAGNYVGEMGLMGNNTRMATVKAAVNTETISINKPGFDKLLEAEPTLRENVQNIMRERLKANTQMESQPEGGDLISFLVKQGVGEATDVLLIDESLCVGCDNCETACAETHNGTSRLNRRAGPSYAEIHVPTSCRHCEHPHCMKDCPPDAIHRAPNGEVFIDDSCIGCGNCQQNCPYKVIQMAKVKPKRGLIQQLLGLGKNNGPEKQAVKCDMCKGQKGGSACVRACPTGAAIRIHPEQLVDLVHKVS